MSTFIALLRGINVGGNNMLPMAKLRAMMEGMGFQDVETLLQSGNVVFRADGKSCAKLEGALAAELERAMKLRIEIIVRTDKEWTDVIVRNPFPRDADGEPSRMVVHFLKAAPEAKAVAAVAGAIKGPERLQASGRELFVVYPDGQGKSTIAKTPGWTKLAAAGTARNWNTVMKLAALARLRAEG